MRPNSWLIGGWVFISISFIDCTRFSPARMPLARVTRPSISCSFSFWRRRYCITQMTRRGTQ
jgi:hypothetical protein